MLQNVVNAFVYSTYLARLPEIRDQAGISIGTLGVVMTVGNLAGFIGSFFAGPIVARLGSKRVAVWAGILYVFALPLIGFSSSGTVLVTAIVGMMIMNVFADVAIMMQASQFGIRRGRSVMSRMSGFYRLGTVAGGIAASWITAVHFGVSSHLFVLAILLAAALVFVAPGLFPVDEHPTEPEPEQAKDRTKRWRVGPALIVLGLASAMAVPLDIVPGEWATFRMTDDLGGSSTIAAVAYFMTATGMAAGGFCGDHLAIRIGRARLATLGTIVSAAGLVVAAVGPGRVSALAGFLVAGLGSSVVAPLLWEAAGRLPASAGSGFGALFVGNRLAGLLTPVMVGSLAATPAFGVGTAMIVVVVPSAVLLLVFARMSIRHSSPG